MNRLFMLGIAALAVASVAIAEDIPWTYDTSKRVAETVSSEQATVQLFDTRFVSSRTLDIVDIDSRFYAWGVSAPGGLDSTPKGVMIIIR